VGPGFRWRIGANVRSTDVGAAAVFAAAVDYDAVPPFPVVGLVHVLGSWLWLAGDEIAWWVGALVEARSAAEAAQRVSSTIAERTGALRSRAMTLNVTPSTAHAINEIVAEEENDVHAVPGHDEPYVVPVRARTYTRRGRRLAIEWTSGSDPLAHVSVAVTESLTIALFEHRPPLTGPQASGDPIVRRDHHVVVDIGDAPAGLPVLDRYSGEYLPEGSDHPDTPPSPPSTYSARPSVSSPRPSRLGAGRRPPATPRVTDAPHAIRGFDLDCNTQHGVPEPDRARGPGAMRRGGSADP